MSSPFDNPYTQRVDKVSTALNEGNTDEAVYQLHGMIKNDPLQAIRLMQDAEGISSPGAIDHITGNCAGDVFIVNGNTGESTFAGRLGSPVETPVPQGFAGDPPPCNDYPIYSMPQRNWQRPHWLAPSCPPAWGSCVFTPDYIAPPYYGGYRDKWNFATNNTDFTFNFHGRLR